MGNEPLRAVELLSDAHQLDQFNSGVEDLDRWLVRSARTAAAAGTAATAATYLLCRGEPTVGYYALAMSAVAHNGTPSRLRRGMPDPVPVVLLARLAIDRAEQGHRLGGYLLVDALRRSVRGGREFGARAIVVDAVDERAAEFTGTSTSTTSTNAGSGDASATSPPPSTPDPVAHPHGSHTEAERRRASSPTRYPGMPVISSHRR